MKRLLILVLCIVLMPSLAAAQYRQVKGVVTDQSGAALPGVGVTEDGTRNGTITDTNGKFSISVQENSVLVFSCLGYKSKEVAIIKQNTISVVLEEDKTLLDEVVVVGFATQKKVNLTGSVATMDSKAFEAVPVQNAVQALQGKVPGLVIT